MVRKMKIGINVLHEPPRWRPDLWTMLKKAGINRIRYWDDWLPPDEGRWRLLADAAASNGMKVMYVLTGSQRAEAKDVELLRQRIAGYRIQRLEGHRGVWGYDVCNEPTVAELDSGVLQQGLHILRNTDTDPAHHVTIGLCTRASYGFAELIPKIVDYVTVVQIHTYRLPNFARGENMTDVFGEVFENEVLPYAQGKPIALGEFGCWTEAGSGMGLESVTFTEDDQANYILQVLAACKKYNLDSAYIWKLVENVAIDNFSKNHYGIYREELVNGANVAKKAVIALKRFGRFPTISNFLYQFPRISQFLRR